MHETNKDLIDEPTITFRLKTMEKKIENLSNRVDKAEHLKSPDEPANNESDGKSMLWLLLILLSLYVLIVSIKNWRKSGK